MKPILAACVVVGFFGCEVGISPVVNEPPVVAEPVLTPRQRLEVDTTTFRLHPGNSGGSFFVRRVLADFASPVPLVIADGWFEAYADSDFAGPTLVVTGLAASLQDVKFSEQQLPPNGLTFTRVRFDLVQPAILHLRWIGGGNLGWAKGELVVELRSFLRLSNGGESPLDVARLTVPVELTVSQTANGLIGTWLQVLPVYSTWSWGGLVELSRPTVSLEAFEVSNDKLPPGAEFN